MAIPAAPAHADVLVEGNHGSATVGEILGKPATFTVGEQIERKSFQFYMPSGAKQGPDVWYMSRMDVAITFAPRNNQGSALVTASVGGHSAAQIEFFPEVTSAGKPRVSWSSADLIRGGYGGQAMGSTAHVRHNNYLIAKAVKPGRSNLVFQVTLLNGAEVEKVKIGPSSGIYASEVGWVELDLRAKFLEQELGVGEEATLEVTVQNPSRREAKRVMLVVQPRSSGLFTHSPVGQIVEGLKGSATRRFVVGATKPGELKVAVDAADPASGEAAKALASVRVVEAQDGIGDGWRALIVACLLGVLGGIAWVQRRGRA